MKTRRQRKGGTRRGGGIMGLARATVSNLKTGGGRVIQFNQIINDMPPDAWRMCKGMLLLMSGEDPTDKKYEKLNVLPTVSYLNSVRERRGVVSQPLKESSEKSESGNGTGSKEEPAQDDVNEGDPNAAEEPQPEDEPEPPADDNNQSADDNNPTDADNTPPPDDNNQSADDKKKEGGTRKNKRNRI